MVQVGVSEWHHWPWFLLRVYSFSALSGPISALGICSPNSRTVLTYCNQMQTRGISAPWKKISSLWQCVLLLVSALRPLAALLSAHTAVQRNAHRHSWLGAYTMCLLYSSTAEAVCKTDAWNLTAWICTSDISRNQQQLADSRLAAAECQHLTGCQHLTAV